VRCHDVFVPTNSKPDTPEVRAGRGLFGQHGKGADPGSLFYVSCWSSRMTTQQILNAFSTILRDLLLDDSIVMTAETRREDIPDWDSFNYINFIVAVENEFRVKFKIADIESFANAGEIVGTIQKMRPDLV
jgi:acyl carrier protein